MDIASSTQLFDAGNYAAVAMHGHRDTWQSYAALGLVGKAKEALSGLGHFKNWEAMFYSGVTHWIDGDDEKAISFLENLDAPHARNLLGLIRKPSIQVLAQLANAHVPSHDTGDRGHFKIRNIGVDPKDLPNAPYADVRNYFDPSDPPDFYVANIGWQPIPSNLQLLSCPLLGQTGDHDMHVQSQHPWYAIFDELIVNDPTEWHDIHHLSGLPAATFPKTHGIGALPELPETPRELDLFVSGVWGHPFHPDKMSLLHQVFSMPDTKMLLLNGYVPFHAYYRLLGNAKVSFSYVRFTRALSTRGLDALGMGCALVIHKDSMITLYAGEEEGVLTYEPGAHDLRRAIEKILANWSRFEKRARKGAELIRDEFSMSRIISQYLRFATFLAARPRRKRQVLPEAILDQKLGSVAVSVETADRLTELNLHRWGPKLNASPNATLLNNMARELVLNATSRFYTEAKPPKADLLQDAINLYLEGIQKFPKSLVLRFNLVRVLFHFGRPGQQVQEALRIAKEAIDLPSNFWEVDVMDDVFPYDYWSTYFNYRSYLGLITKSLIEKRPATSHLVELLLASLHYYVGNTLGDLDHLKEAYRLDPAFPYYALACADRLVKRGNREDDSSAGTILISLVENSMLFMEAYDRLKRLHQRKRFVHERFDEIERTINQCCINYVATNEDWSSDILTVPTRDGVPSYSRESQGETGSNARAESAPEVSIIIPVLNSPMLTRQCVNRILRVTDGVPFEIIVVDNLAREEIPTNLSCLDDRVRMSCTYGYLSLFEAFHRGAACARGPYLVFLQHDALPMGGWLSALLQEAKVHPEVAVVGSKLVTLDGRISHAGLVFSRSFKGPSFVYRDLMQSFDKASYRREIQGVVANGMLVKRKDFEEVGGFDTSYHNPSLDFCLKMRERRMGVVFQPNSLLTHLDPLFLPNPSPLDLEDGERLRNVYRSRLLEYDDAFYFQDGYAARVLPVNEQRQRLFRIEPIEGAEEMARWQLVATLQQLGESFELATMRPLLLHVDSWPQDHAVLEWGAQLCVLSGIPEQAKVFQEKILSLGAFL